MGGLRSEEERQATFAAGYSRDVCLVCKKKRVFVVLVALGVVIIVTAVFVTVLVVFVVVAVMF